MKVTLVGMGLGAHDTLTLQALHLLQEADFIVGAKRLLETLPDGCTQHRFAATKPEAILQSLLQSAAQHPCVAYSGDTGFYSGTRSLLPLLKARGITAEVFSGISSVQYFAARLARSWQDWSLVSAHGTACDAPAALRCQKPVFFLTGGVLTPATLCEQLVQTGLGALRVTVGEQLSYDTECIREGTAAEFAQQTFAPLSVLLAEAAPPFARRTPGISDALFVRGDVPMTKQEVRAVALAKLQVTPEDICWDIGAGTGSVSVELALQANAVYAVERSAKAYHLAEQNKAKFGVWNLHLKRAQPRRRWRSCPRRMPCL
ncbi:MAG: precorrin-6y C5,15-methyltransferase (decarboxylating) subunit CbiE [Pygmaiobacter sp.]